MAVPQRKVVSLAHIKAEDKPKPTVRRIAHHGGKVTTNKPAALLQFLARKKLAGEKLTPDQDKMVEKLKLDISKELQNEKSLWTPNTQASMQELWAAFSEKGKDNIESLALPARSVGELVKGGGSKRKAQAGPPLSKEEAKRRFLARKAAAAASAAGDGGGGGGVAAAKHAKSAIDAPPPRPVGFDVKAFVLAWAKSVGTGREVLDGGAMAEAVRSYAGREATPAEGAACEAALSAMATDEAVVAGGGVVQRYIALKWLKENSNALFDALAAVPPKR